jgi:hypothetical protein
MIIWPPVFVFTASTILINFQNDFSQYPILALKEYRPKRFDNLKIESFLYLQT